jgi:hypothetical protein
MIISTAAAMHETLGLRCNARIARGEATPVPRKKAVLSQLIVESETS